MSRSNIDKLILGTVQFGLEYGVNNQTGRPSSVEVKNILSIAKESGIRALDTADAYGNAQEVLSAKNLNTFQIFSKFILNEDCYSVGQCLENTLKRLNVENIEGYSCHRFSDLHRCSFEDVQRLKSSGLMKYFGVSIYSNEELKKAIRNPNIDVIQIPFNLLDNNSQRGELLAEAKNSEKIIHVRSVFLQGLFFKPVESLRGNLVQLKGYLDELHKISIRHDFSIEEMCLSYVFHCPYVNGIVLGVDTSAQLQRNIECIKGLRTNEEMFEEINKIVVLDQSLLNPANWRVR